MTHDTVWIWSKQLSPWRNQGQMFLIQPPGYAREDDLGPRGVPGFMFLIAARILERRIRDGAPPAGMIGLDTGAE
ncbi:hypothetical protein RB195_022133 [Necator americanus]|uniref:Uncharacterized protein n=1 Tax=Necator americanus TaxID=51031 RepID=A0ABR1EE18_NECAM